MLGSPTSSASAARQAARQASASNVRLFARSFFGAAFLLGLALIYAYGGGGGGVGGAGKAPGGVRVVPLPPRQGHSLGGGHAAAGAAASDAHAGHDHGAAPGHGHTHEPGAAAVPAARRVERRTRTVEGREVTEETTFYGPAAMLSAAELAELGPAAAEAARSGSELAVVRRVRKKRDSAGDVGRSARKDLRDAEAELEVEGPEAEEETEVTAEEEATAEAEIEAEAKGAEAAKLGEAAKLAEAARLEAAKVMAASAVVDAPAGGVPALPSSADAWVDLPIPNRQPGWPPAQRPIPGERGVTSHAFEELAQHSMVPPDLPPAGSAARLELDHRLIVAVALGVHSGTIKVATAADLKDLAIVKVLLASFLPTAQPHHNYRFYFAFDHNDKVFEQEQWRAAITQLFAEGFAAEDATRWHPEGATGALDASRLTHSVHWVHCDYAGKPSWAHSDAVVAAYREGADYAYRTNDDSKFPEERAWADIWIESLRGRTPVANLGVVGPTCHEGATWILTHDFTHKTHVVVFGFQYPRGLPDWSSDDWITFVYDAFGMMRKEARTVTGHTFMQGTRYEPTGGHLRLPALNQNLQSGAQLLDAWLKARGHSVPHTVKTVTCC